MINTKRVCIKCNTEIQSWGGVTYCPKCKKIHPPIKEIVN